MCRPSRSTDPDSGQWLPRGMAGRMEGDDEGGVWDFFWGVG